MASPSAVVACPSALHTIVAGLVSSASSSPALAGPSAVPLIVRKVDSSALSDAQVVQDLEADILYFVVAVGATLARLCALLLPHHPGPVPIIVTPLPPIQEAQPKQAPQKRALPKQAPPNQAPPVAAP